MTPAAVILAAGASSRLGIPKQLIPYKGLTLVDRAIQTAHESGCSPIVVVLGASAELIQQQCSLTGAIILFNPDWRQGMAASLRVGIAAVEQSEASIVLTCDMPAVTPAHLRALAAGGELTASRYAGRTGVPAFFHRHIYPQLLALKGDEGARSILANARAIDLPGGELDVDTPEDLAALRIREAVYL